MASTFYYIIFEKKNPLDFYRMSHDNNDVIIKIRGRAEDGKMMTMCT